VSFTKRVSWLGIVSALLTGAVLFDRTVEEKDVAGSSSASIFEHRFTFTTSTVLLLQDSPLRPIAAGVSSSRTDSFQRAKQALAQKLTDASAALSLSLDPKKDPSVPLPRARPVQANLEAKSTRSNQLKEDSLFDKLTGFFGGSFKLASLAPDDSIWSTEARRSLGLDDHTAIYDISARTVYMPNGSKLEAHSGLGDLKDDPHHVSERNVGSTPPAIYDLKPREKLFHGVSALRMIPVNGQDILGRDGLLAHSYMLGPYGDSNGCVSIREYDKFLDAFQNGEINRLLVVTSLSDAKKLSPI
jgi:Tlde1 domain